jgi:hypothetical protein
MPNIRNRPLNAAFHPETREFMDALVCNLCYRGLYGFQYNPDLLLEAVFFLDKYTLSKVFHAKDS